MKSKILILNGQYLPGYKGGGPIRSIENIVNNLSDYYKFYIVTSDRDFKDDKPYENIVVNAWNKVGAAEVYYMDKSMQTLKGFEEVINSIDYDFLYLNGFFSPIFTIRPLILKKMKRLKNNNVILTPRGDFSGGLEVKKLKKYIYIFFVKLLGVYNNIKWHSTSVLESNDIKKVFKEANIFEVSNLSNKLEHRDIAKNKNKGFLDLVFISRIHRKKNLLFTLKVLSNFKFDGIIKYDIFGPIEDFEYWNECKKYIESMPENVKVKYKGELNHNDVNNTLEKYHCLFFPTLGENYGHVIVEAMYSGCLLLISNKTPWINLYKEGIGWDIDLEDENGYAKAIEIMLNMDNNTFKCKVSKLISFCINNCNNKKDIIKYLEMFNKK